MAGTSENAPAVEQKRFYQKIRDLYALAIDYDPATDQTKEFFRIVQNKLHWAVTGSTAAEIIADRASAEKPNMMATERRALDALQEMGADVRVPYDTAQTRLHAKAWLFHRATFERILPHVKGRSVESILDALPGRWRKGTLRRLLRGMRPGLPVILATCRAHGQDEEPWHILMAWVASHPSS